MSKFKLALIAIVMIIGGGALSEGSALATTEWIATSSSGTEEFQATSGVIELLDKSTTLTCYESEIIGDFVERVTDGTAIATVISSAWNPRTSLYL